MINMYIYTYMHISMCNGRTIPVPYADVYHRKKECSTQNCWKYGKPTQRIQNPPEKFVGLMVEKIPGFPSHIGEIPNS